MPRLETANCRSCGALIYWIETERGKKMPVDTGRVAIMVPDEDGRNAKLVYGYQSHFTTCPDAKKHRAKPVQKARR